MKTPNQYGYDAIEKTCKDLETQEYLKVWTNFHQGRWEHAQDYVESIRQAQQAASLKAIKEVIS